MTEYVELHAASAFSFLEGSSLPETLIETAVEKGLPSIAITDRNGIYGAARFHTMAKKSGIRAHIGAEISVRDFGNRMRPPRWLPQIHIDEPSRITLLCTSQKGYQNLCQLITSFKLRERVKEKGPQLSMNSKSMLMGLFALLVERKVR